MKKIKALIKKRGISVRNWILYWFTVGVGIIVLIYLVTSTWIGFEISVRCELVTSKYGGDCVEGLINYLEDEQNEIGDRNTAIWTLGQLGSKRSLPTLRKMYTGRIPDKEPWNGVISQYELKKAIKLSEGEFNISALVWRCFIPPEYLSD